MILEVGKEIDWVDFHARMRGEPEKLVLDWVENIGFVASTIIWIKYIPEAEIVFADVIVSFIGDDDEEFVPVKTSEGVVIPLQRRVMVENVPRLNYYAEESWKQLMLAYQGHQGA